MRGLLQMKSFIHYSAQPLTEIHSVEQAPIASHQNFKPFGLWFSVEPGFGWLEWCEGEEFNLGNFEHGARLHLAENASILRLTCDEDVNDFHLQFARSLHYGLRMQAIDWQAVGALYQGIVIAPYRRMWGLEGVDRLWHSCWDCDSGCIWDASAIAKVEQLTEFRRPRVRSEAAE